MGLMEYRSRNIFKQRDTKGKKSPATQQTAVMAGQFANDYEDNGSADNELLSEENTPASGQAEGSGFIGWVDGLFAEDINFSFHGTRIKGKDKRQVKGGRVPLFDGVVLDLTQASMTGTAEGERQTVRPVEGGTPAMLLVTPARREITTKGHFIKDFVITAPKKGNADGFSAEIAESIRYDLGGDVWLHAKGAVICEELVVLVDPSLGGVRGDGEIGGAMINENGIRITPKESPTKSEEENTEGREAAADSGASEVAEAVSDSGVAEVVEAAPGSGVAEVVQAASGSGASEVVKAAADNGVAEVVKAAAEAAPVKESHKAGSQPEVQKKEEKKKEEGKKGEENKEEEDQRKYLDLKKRELSIAGEDQNLKGNLESGEMSGKKGDLEGQFNLYNKTFKFSWGNTWPPEKDEGDKSESESESKEESDKSQSDKKTASPPALKEAMEEALKGYYNKVEENSKEAAEKLGFGKNALIEFFQTGKLPENPYKKKEAEGENAEGENAENQDDKELTLKAKADILPGIAVVGSLKPSWNFGFHFDLEMAKAAEKVPKVEVKVENGKVKEISAPDIERVLSLTAEVKGKIGATLRLALQAGVGYLLYLEGGLFAKGEARGTLDGSDNVFGRAKIDLPMTMSGTSKKVTTGDTKMNLEAGIGLFGSVGGDVKVASEIFDWEKELFSKTFKEWNLAEFKGAMELKHSKNSGHILNPKNWEKEKSKFTVGYFKEHIEKEKKYGLVMTDASAINMKIEEGKSLGEKLTGIRDKLTKIQEQISGGPAGGQFAAENSEAYDKLMKELEAINLHLSDLILAGTNRLAEMKAAALEYKQDKRYKSNKAKAEAGKEKHEKRHEHMEEWGKAFEGQEAVRDVEAYAHYAKKFDAQGAERQRKKAQLETAKKSLADKDSLIKYEEGRAKDLGSKHNDRIKKLDELLKKVPEDKRNVINPEFVRQYKAMGASALIDKAPQHVGKELLINYETKYLEHYRKTHKERSEKLLEKLGKDNLNITEENRKKPNRAFAEYYYNELGGKRLFSEDELLNNHQNGKEIVEYELSRLKDRAGAKNIERIDKLKELKKRYEKEDTTEAEKKAIMAEAQEYYKNVGKGKLGNRGQGKMDIAASASKQDILDYESKRRNEYQEGSGKDQKTYEVEKEALDKLKSITVKEKNDGSDLLSKMEEKKLKQVWKIYKDWLKGQEDDKVKDIVPLRMIVEYEKEQQEIIRNKPFKKKKTDAEIAEDRKFKQHADAYKMMNNKYLELRNAQDEGKVEEETKKTKDAYFKDSADFLKKIKKGDIEDNELLKEVLEKKMENYGHVHADRLKKLREFMGLEKDSNDAGKSSKSDAQVWEYYKSIGAGKAFADEYAKQKKGKYSINDMLRFEQHEARENSMTNAFKAAVSRKVESTIAEYTTSEGGDKLEEKRKKEKEGGHYDRYEALNAMLEKGESDKKIVEYYLSIGAGGGYVDFLRKGDHFLDVVTPDEILHYEETRNGKDGEAHARRLKMLKSLGDDMTDEAVYAKYHEEVMKDHSVKQFFEKIGIKQNIKFDGTIDPEYVLTPQMIYDYETKRVAQLTEKHTTRIEKLKDADEENAYTVYKEAGGQRGFMRANKEQLKEKVSEVGDSHSYQNILDYDKKRSEFYQKILDEINEPLKRIEEAQKKLEKQITEAQESQQAVQKYLDPSGKKAAFSSPSAFDQFAEETSGTNAQNIVDNGQEKIEEQVKAAEEAQAEAEQIMDEKMKLLEENPGA